MSSKPVSKMTIEELKIEIQRWQTYISLNETTKNDAFHRRLDLLTAELARRQK